MKQVVPDNPAALDLDAKLGQYVSREETKIRTRVGRFTLYPGDKVDTADPWFLIVIRDGQDLRIPWEIIID